jgi:D-galactonate transporter
MEAITSDSPLEAAVYRKITWRIMPFLFLCYVLAYVDRVNVGFAKLQMQQALGMSDSVYGLGAGIFFIGYFLFEVPANLMLQRIGARRWIGPIMIAWGFVSACTLCVKGAAGFYVFRFLLGIVECGFFPGVILYLTYWYTQKHRARMVAIFMSAVPISTIFAGPLSGWILARMNDVGHLSAWQWLFLVEGIPSVIVGLITLLYLTDHPCKARWLNEDERKLVLLRLQEEEDLKKKTGRAGHSLKDAFRSVPVWLLSLAYFGSTAGNYGITFWLPQLIKETLTKDPLAIGWISTLPGVASILAMFIWGHHSDKTGERRWHMALAAIFGAAFFAISAIPGISGVAGMAAITIASAALMCQFAVFWSLPTAILSGSAAAAGIAWINSIGNLAGYASPHAVGFLRDQTRSMIPALLALCGAQLLTAIMILVVTRQKTHRGRTRRIDRIGVGPGQDTE